MPATSSAPGSQPESVAVKNARRQTAQAVKSAAKQTAKAVTTSAAITEAATSSAASIARAASAPAPKGRSRSRSGRRSRPEPALQYKPPKPVAVKVRKDLKTLDTPKARKAARRPIYVAPHLQAPVHVTRHRTLISPKVERRVSERTDRIKAQKPQPAPKKPKRPPVQKVRRQYAKGKRTLPGLDAEQTKVAAKVLKTGLKSGATKKELLAAAETGLVESGFRNLSYGDADSEGWRQERTSIYGPTAPTNVKGAAKRFFAESVSDTGGSRGKGQTAGELAQTIQGSAFPERYDQVRDQAKPIVKAFLSGKKPPPPVKQLSGPFSGSKTFVREIVGAKVRSDHGLKNEGTVHTPTGDHYDPHSYAQDINNPAGNPAEGEPPYNQATLDKIVANLRKRGADVPDLRIGQNWEGIVQGYRVQLLTNEGGEISHIHLGARWEGAPTSTSAVSGTAAGATAGGSTSAAPVVANPNAPVFSKRSKKRRKRRRSHRQPQIRLRVPAQLDPTDYQIKPSTQSYADYVRSAPARVEL